MTTDNTQESKPEYKLGSKLSNTQAELRTQIETLIFAKFYDVPEKQRTAIVSNLSKLITSHTNNRIEEVLSRLEEQGIDAQYYIPNSPDDTYTTGEVVRLSAIETERKRLKEGL